MYHRGGVKRVVDGGHPPPPDVKAQPPFHSLVGNVAECVIEKMRENESEHYEPGCEPYLPDANAPQQERKLHRAVHARRANVNVGGCLWRHDGPSFECQSSRTIEENPAIFYIKCRVERSEE